MKGRGVFVIMDGGRSVCYNETGRLVAEEGSSE